MQRPSTTGAEPDGELPSAGRRWGVGTGSILAHLNHSLRAKPVEPEEAFVASPPHQADPREAPPS